MALLFSLLLTALYCFVYVVLFFLFPTFFNQAREKLSKRSLISLGIIILLSFVAYIISYNIANEQIGNRFLHGFGGGFLAFLMCWLVARDTKLKITKFQFFVFSFLIVTGLGVANELLEFLLQSTTSFIFSPTATDTWLDLLSNTIGALIASAIFVLPVGIEPTYPA